MKRIAVFADIHGNIDALRAICDDIQKEGITEIYSFVMVYRLMKDQ